ncbi:FYVE-domain-containing protein [Hypoxylon trugodes]|uniref:FYVE-domain-containing protein n=1 Tax=Hypoxylon trugodes TaxID=326681 RepID=UPI002195A1EF|nr:FYVE-domain-containing protein [Hypoxylon trugodes]KAI1390103.1 FYVE-domain-containing protein [Hypoxylon trugodes]
MSDNNGADSTPSLSRDSASDISDTESGSSYIGSAAPDTPACPYQNAEFFGQECSRYHDCPTHLAERNTDENIGNFEASVPIETTSSQAQDSAANGAITENLDVGLDGASTSAPEQALASGTQLIQPEANSSSSGEGSTSQVVSRAEAGPVTQEEGITLREALDQTAESLRGLSAGLGVPSRSSQSSRSQLRDTSQGAGEAPETVSELRPSSRLNPIAPPFSPRPERRAPQELSLPRWQPDSEATFCPICRTQFSFFVRKHHCRKCGRVVCNSCSPHRITIPHQYIVRPPGERSLHPYSFLGDEGRLTDFSDLGGGEQVRLCNPCVPDPNTTPPQTQHSPSPFSPRAAHQRSQSSSSTHYNGDSGVHHYPPYLVPPNPTPDAYARSRSVTMNSSAGSSRIAHSTYLPPQSRIITGTPPTYYPSPYSGNSGYRHPSLLGHRFPGASLVDLAGPSSSSSAAAMNRPLPPPPQIPEEDECPICHRELPSRDLPNFEARRESHIDSCIMAHSAYNPPPDAMGRPVGRGTSGTTAPRYFRRTGMFPYLATEKDCVDSAECTICLEEFEVGVPMARLECLCRFHRSCITEWFVDHPGRCPVHQHDTFGF